MPVRSSAYDPVEAEVLSLLRTSRILGIGGAIGCVGLLLGVVGSVVDTPGNGPSTLSSYSRTLLLCVFFIFVPTSLLSWVRRADLLGEVRAAGGTDAATAAAALRRVYPGWQRRLRAEAGSPISLGLLLALAPGLGAASRELGLAAIPLVVAVPLALGWLADRRAVR